jgi:type IV secretory pathway TrbD component
MVLRTRTLIFVVLLWAALMGLSVWLIQHGYA